ncbi:MAG: cellobiose phosphorylase [Candidatus Omnitrophota bacterium]|nr:cellobiose phosphorylase [Candidatus Omnitrophota bacterium]
MKISTQTPKYYLNEAGQFVIENYNYAKPFSNFFPGIAGKYGIPMWTFYVNRGQAISSFGIKDKDHAILEFLPANKAWQLVSSQGFRTFIKISTQAKTIFYEPFHNGFSNLNYNIHNKMLISPWGLSLEETNSTLGLKVRVEYFNIPSDNYAGLSRILTIENTSRTDKKIELIDGLPQIIPFGTNNFFLKKMSRTIEAWMEVENLKNKAPFYRLKVDPVDRPEVIHINEGNFYLGFTSEGNQIKLTQPIIDAEDVFAEITDFSLPINFIKNKGLGASASKKLNAKTPSAFSFLNLKLAKEEEKTLYSVIGYMRSLEALNKAIPKITSSGYLEKKKAENRRIIEELMNDIHTSSSSKVFDLYAQQTYLDNLMRGGYPLTFKSGKTFYLYARKHGDPERDYNKFQIAPTYFAQGNGNYRDLNQNRRNDIWFNPEIKDENVTTLFNLIQLDGFNPLTVKGSIFILKDKENLRAKLNNIAPENKIDRILSFLEKKFTPGELILFIEDNKIKLNATYDELLDLVIASSLKIDEAEHGEGFWSDHWHYNLDILESYLKVYPEELKKIVFEERKFTFFDNSEVVKPRSEKYLLYNGKPRQLHSVVNDNFKKEALHKRRESPHLVRALSQGEQVYETVLINKLLCLVANKFASLDPFGIGIEMEADKPNWFDSLNGLPALFGSSLCETFELKRLCLFIQGALQKTGVGRLNITEEIYALLSGLNQLTLDLSNNKIDDYSWWDQTHSAKENYRLLTKMGVSGNEREISPREIIGIIDTLLKQIDAGINKAWDEKKKTYCGYFINEVITYKTGDEHFIKPTEFRQIKLPLFLETQMHGLRLADNQEKARKIHLGTKNSGLFDQKLKMYKVTAALGNMPEDIGRCRIFTPGWLENESIWLHMEYKYLLELLKTGLYEEFYADFKNVLIPFQKPAVYGRSILENSSFLVSSAFPDKKLHGNGFVARLSGSTAEFLQIWLTMNIGKNPFFLENDKLALRFEPKLNGWLFNKRGNYSFNFLGKINVTYHNPKRKDTFGKHAAQIIKVILWDKDKPIEFNSSLIPSPYAEAIRSRQISKIDIYLV